MVYRSPWDKLRQDLLLQAIRPLGLSLLPLAEQVLWRS